MIEKIFKILKENSSDLRNIDIERFIFKRIMRLNNFTFYDTNRTIHNFMNLPSHIPLFGNVLLDNLVIHSSQDIEFSKGFTSFIFIKKQIGVNLS